MKNKVFVMLLLIICSCVVVAQDETANPKPFEYKYDLIQQADAGDRDAQFKVGYCYYGFKDPVLCRHSGVVQNLETSYKYLQMAAKQGHVYAQYLIGCFWYYGYKPVKQDYKKARSYYEEAANKKCADALYNLGCMYHYGTGVSADINKAIFYYRQSAELGCAMAQYNLYVVLKSQGKIQEAYQWAEKAAAQNQQDAMGDLGSALVQGNGVTQDVERGLEMLKKSADMGCNVSLNNLGVYYFNGIGVTQDQDIATLYFYKAAKNGYENSKVALKQCYDKGTCDALAFNNYGEWVSSLANKRIESMDRQSVKNNAVTSHTPTVSTPKEEKKMLSDVDLDIPANAVDNANTFVVIFANENYQEEVKVDYALNDGEMFKTYCEKVLGVPGNNIHIRKDATLNNMRAEMSWMQQVAKAYKGSARFIVYYAGHGIPDEKSGVSYLLPVDGKGTMLDTGYSLALFYKQLGQLQATNVMVFMDACFSGSKRGDGMLASARGVAIKAKPQAPQGNMVVFSAAQGDETAYPYKEKGHGLFTYYLLKKLKETGGNVTYGELGTYIEEEVTRKSIVSNGKSQTPTVIPSQSLSGSWQTMKLK